MLSAYRRDDWSSAELAALSQHLASCAACRQLEASYRQAGERVRQLPTIVPPPSFRDSVFAAIRAEGYTIPRGKQQSAREAVAAAEADTSPSLPVVSAPRPDELAQRRARKAFRPTATQVKAGVAVAAAVCVLSFTASRLLPHSGMGLGNNAASLSNGLSHSSNAGVAQYATNGTFGAVTGARASARWVVFMTGSGEQLVALDRQSHATRVIARAAAGAPLALRVVTDEDWVIWTTGDTSGSSWTLEAAHLGTAAAPITVLRSRADGSDTPALLTGVSAHANAVLVSGQTFSGTGGLWRVDLTAATPSPLALHHASNAGTVLSDPSEDGDTAYWAEVASSGGVLQSTVWRERPGAAAERVLDDTHAFHPVAANGSLLWVEPTSAPASGSDEQTVVSTLGTVSGAVDDRDLSSGKQWQLAQDAPSQSVCADGTVAAWSSASGVRTYNLVAHAPAQVDASVRGASSAAVSAGNLVWVRGDTIFVYNPSNS